jgi:1,4-dihydroxy-6-naphthoate synthase
VLVHLGYGDDLGDALLWEALTDGSVETGSFEFELARADIHTLNAWVLQGRLDASVLSLATYPLVQDEYSLLVHGTALVSADGPVVVSRELLSLEQLRTTEVVVPATVTTGFVLLRMALGGEVRNRVVAHDEILDEVATGAADAGLIRHEGEPTLDDLGLTTSLDLTEWWLLETGLPLPLRAVVARREIAPALAEVLRGVLAAGSARVREVAGPGPAVWDDADEARQAVEELLRRAEAAGVYDRPVRVEFAG